MTTAHSSNPLPPPEQVNLSGKVTAAQADLRLDQAMAQLFPAYSRSRFAQWIREGAVRIDGEIEQRLRYKVQVNQRITLEARLAPRENWHSQADLPLTIIDEDDALLIIDKPAGLVVHPGNGNPDGTLVNALLHYAPELAHLPRAGLVHRLDKDTTGLLAVARTLEAHKQLTDQLQARKMEREYEAIVHGTIIAGGTIDEPLGRDQRHRTRMAVMTPDTMMHNSKRARSAITHYRVLAKYPYHTHIQVNLETGRTHQIRVHLAHIHHPLVGDTTYGGKRLAPKQLGPNLSDYLNAFPRQALHARRLGLIHPITKTMCRWESPLPEDMLELLRLLDSCS